jgi:hypothetical protein
MIVLLSCQFCLISTFGYELKMERNEKLIDVTFLYFFLQTKLDIDLLECKIQLNPIGIMKHIKTYQLNDSFMKIGMGINDSIHLPAVAKGVHKITSRNQ